MVRRRKMQDLPPSFLPKPKGMHWRTYEKLRMKIDIRNQ
jgi:hypothetical protein